MEEIKNEQVQEHEETVVACNDAAHRKEKIDDLFAAFEQAVAQPKLFHRAGEGETCEFCSA